jgi:hypothetical protein
MILKSFTLKSCSVGLALALAAGATSAALAQGQTPAQPATPAPAPAGRPAFGPPPPSRATPLPGTQDALRRLIEQIAAGKPNYDQMTERFANSMRPKMDAAQKWFSQYGAIQAITFRGAAPPPDQGDMYYVQFANGSIVSEVAVDTAGKVEALFKPAAPPAAK